MPRIDNSVSFNKLREIYPEFSYENYSYSLVKNVLSLQFEFHLSDDIIFRPHSILTFPASLDIRHNDALINNLVFHIGLIELVSYWKATCSPLITIKTGKLDNQQIEWWKNLFYNGLGEFMYLNSIEISSSKLMEIVSNGKSHVASSASYTDNYIVPIGGGKDSSVTLELLRKKNLIVNPLIMNPREATVETVTTAGLSMDDVIIINRTIDPLLLELNAKGFLNGHTPFSAMLAFYCLLASAITGIRNIALSNEASANEATVPGTDINHQYSKSFEFERDFRKYSATYIDSGINYFSFLRPLNELQIMSIFARLPQYHPVFKSCNVGSKTNTWCGGCAKCLFTHIMLAAYKGVSYANDIIGKPMLDDIHNQEIFRELAGISEIKPFECVGTINDVQQAINLIIANTEQAPRLIEMYRSTREGTEFISRQNGLQNTPENPAKEYLQDISDKTETHFLTKTQWEILQKALN